MLLIPKSSLYLYASLWYCWNSLRKGITTSALSQREASGVVNEMDMFDHRFSLPRS